ncbi:hypothetical protein L484_024740 [Morus notabilis]|uniref:Uncharacterized protein n=1 Tax=Morus notabilis TaxID=981085 RepID=W9RD04_9ROSA|nr:hypothetical protein L484_024740 [Morus notabilis]
MKNSDEYLMQKNKPINNLGEKTILALELGVFKLIFKKEREKVGSERERAYCLWWWWLLTECKEEVEAGGENQE